MPKKRPPCACGKPSISGGVRLCQYHWNTATWGKKWADEVERRKKKEEGAR